MEIIAYPLQLNILLTLNGNPVLADFGLSLALDASLSFAAHTTAKQAGTAAWMAAELFIPGLPASKESDVWAFGSVAYVCDTVISVPSNKAIE